MSRHMPKGGLPLTEDLSSFATSESELMKAYRKSYRAKARELAAEWADFGVKLEDGACEVFRGRDRQVLARWKCADAPEVFGVMLELVEALDYLCRVAELELAIDEKRARGRQTTAKARKPSTIAEADLRNAVRELHRRRPSLSNRAMAEMICDRFDRDGQSPPLRSETLRRKIPGWIAPAKKLGKT